MRKGVIEAVYAAGFVLVCFVVVNAVQIWDVHYDHSDRAGFPLVCYSRGGVAGAASLDEKAVLLNYFIATAVALHVALSVFALINAKAIIRRIRRNGKLEG